MWLQGQGVWMIVRIFMYIVFQIMMQRKRLWDRDLCMNFTRECPQPPWESEEKLCKGRSWTMLYCTKGLSWSWGAPEFRGSFRLVPNWGKGAEPLCPYIDQSLAALFPASRHDLRGGISLSQGQFLEDSTAGCQQLTVLEAGGVSSQHLEG